MTVRLRELYEIYPPDPRATMPIGIRVDNWLYGSVSAIDPMTGRFEGDTRTQMQRAIAAMRHVLVRGGMKPINLRAVQVLMSGEDPEYEASLQEGFYPQEPEYEGLSRSRLPLSTFATLNLFADRRQLAPCQHVRVDFTACVGQSEWLAKLQTPAVLTAPDAVKIGPVLWTPIVTGARMPNGALPSTIEAQVDATFDNLEQLMQRTGVGRGQVLRIAGYMRDLKDKDLLNHAMVGRFPVWAEKPVHKYVPSALPPGVEFALQAIAVEGAPRRILEIEGIKHNDPISLGAQVGNVFVSSRVQARTEPTAGKQAARLVESHARRLVEHIGGSLADVTQLVWGIGDPAFESEVRAECARRWPPDRQPQLGVMQAAFPHSPLPRLEFVALLDRNEP